MNTSVRIRVTRSLKWIVAIAASAAILLPSARTIGRAQVSKSFEQSTAREFDAVSVKPMQQKGERFAMTWHVDPKMINITAEFLQTYVHQAYDLKPYQVVLKGADWIASERYDIQARVDQPATEDEMMLMLRKALADRFHLRVHVEMREMPVYFLNVDRRGIKMHEATVTTGPNLSFHLTDVNATHLAMVDFVDILSNFVTDRPVLDRTQLKPEYQFKLEFAPLNASPDNPSDKPSIFTALQDQIGLKLDAGKAPVEVLVIDSAERPQAN
jgi:uncharacterized protein (TIGR03435 family)